MIHLELDEAQRDALADTLEVYLSDLRMEISHTDRLDYRNMLRRKKELLNGILAQLRPVGSAP